MEKRKHRRIYKCLPLIFQTMGASAPELPDGQGVLKDISLGGIYFKCKEPPYLGSGQVLNLLIQTTATPPSPETAGTLRFKGQGTVIRIIPPSESSVFYEVAVKFLEPLDAAKIVQECQPKNLKNPG